MSSPVAYQNKAVQTQCQIGSNPKNSELNYENWEYSEMCCLSLIAVIFPQPWAFNLLEQMSIKRIKMIENSKFISSGSGETIFSAVEEIIYEIADVIAFSILCIVHII